MIYICDKCPATFTVDHTLPHASAGKVCDGTAQKYYTAEEYEKLEDEIKKLKDQKN